jgi:chorismate mutase-like protein
MPNPVPTLDELRRKIDEIDDALHDLLIHRVDVVTSIGALKKDNAVPAIRPGREAAILRRLVARHKGPLPHAILVRLWRELLSGTTGIQVDFKVAVYAPDATPGFWDIARDHFGSHTPMTSYRSPTQVMHAVTEAQAMVGILPMPAEGEADPWWPHLVSADAKAPRVIARLPFAGRGNARGEDGDALVIGRGEPEPTGADRSLVVIETRSEMSRARLRSALAEVGLDVTLFIPFEQRPDASINLLELDGLVASGDPRFAKALEQWGEAIDRVVALGSYAQPLTPAELAGPAKKVARSRDEAR